MYRVTLVSTQRRVLNTWSRQRCTGLHWYAHREGCCTHGAGRSVQGYIGTHTERDAVQMEQAEVYRLHWYAHTEGCCTNGTVRSVQVTLVRTQRDAVQMEQAEVYRLHWYAHRKGCCTNGAGRSVQGYIGTHTERDAVQMEQAEVYRLHWYAHTDGCCTNGAGRSVQVTLVHTQRDAVQMEHAEVYMVTLVRTQRGVLYKWSRQKCTGLHWYAHRQGCCTNGAGKSVRG